MPAAPDPAIRSVGRVLPPHYVPQEELIAALREHWARRHHNVDRLEELHRAARVRGRHLALPLSGYVGLEGFGRTNDAWIRAATDLGEAAVRAALDRAGLEPRDVDHLLFVTVTGIATPSIDARLVDRLGLRPDVRRTPIFGLGCVGGVAGLARAADWARGFPSGIAVLLSVELCSLTLQRDDGSIANVVASGLFGDGAAAVVVAGGDAARPGDPRIPATRSVFYPGTERIMGWDVVDTGFRVVLSAEVPRLVREKIGGDVDAFLGAHGLGRGGVRHWIAHTGGPKILDAFQGALGLPDGALARSRRSLEEVGNLSSASALFVLGDHLEAGEARPGDHGLLAAMGPGFCAELALVRW
jgi:alkylresorcinol/alkylpyrone synthase